MSSENKFDLMVLGAGPGGYAAAFRAADLGLKVALVDKELNPGGVCLYRGCIPSKALLHMSYLKEHISHLENHWLDPSPLTINLEKLRNFKISVVEQMTQGLSKLAKLRKIQFFEGVGHFENAKSLLVENGENKQTIHFEYGIIATGSKPAWPSFLPPMGSTIMDSTKALDLENIPESLLCLGGGVIGIELASIYNALGSKVKILEMADQILPGCDLDMVRFILRQLKKRGIEFETESKLTGIQKNNSGLEAQWESSKNKEQTNSQNFEKALICVGRVPNGKNLGLENTKIKLNEKGFIDLAEELETQQENIFAIGDVIGNPMLAHKASSEAHRVVDYIVQKKWKPAPLSIPNVVYCYPEIAWCGLSEVQLKEKQIEYKMAKFPWAASGRATTCAENEGFTKLMFDPNSHKLLGAGIYGAGAGEQIALANLCVEMELTLEQISRAVFPHPTMSETFLEAVEIGLGHADHYYIPKK